MIRRYILIADDDPQVDLRRDLMIRRNFQVLYARNIEQALHFAETIPEIRFGVLDIRFGEYAPYSPEETRNGDLAGMRLLRDLEDLLPFAKFLLKTATGNISELEDMVRGRTSVAFPFVVEGRVDSDDIERRAEEAYTDGRLRPWILIVHGHDRNAVSALQGLLSRRFGFNEAYALQDLDDRGLATVIESSSTMPVARTSSSP